MAIFIGKKEVFERFQWMHSSVNSRVSVLYREHFIGKDVIDLDNKIYCIACNQFVEKQLETKVFKTGFYKRVHTLGICPACSANKEHNPIDRDQELDFIFER